MRFKNFLNNSITKTKKISLSNKEKSLIGDTGIYKEVYKLDSTQSIYRFDKNNTSMPFKEKEDLNKLKKLIKSIKVNEKGFKNYPKGWNRSSVRKFAKTISKNIGKDVDEKGWFDACVRKMEPEMGEGAKGFCASVKDEYFGQTKWRSGDKTIKPGKVSKKIDEGDDLGSINMNVIKRIYKPRFNKIKNESQLDDLYNNILQKSKRWNWADMDKEEIKWLEQQFDKVSKRLNLNKFYKLNGKGKPQFSYGS